VLSDSFPIIINTDGIIFGVGPFISSEFICFEGDDVEDKDGDILCVTELLIVTVTDAVDDIDGLGDGDELVELVGDGELVLELDLEILVVGVVVIENDSCIDFDVDLDFVVVADILSDN